MISVVFLKTYCTSIFWITPNMGNTHPTIVVNYPSKSDIGVSRIPSVSSTVSHNESNQDSGDISRALACKSDPDAIAFLQKELRSVRRMLCLTSAFTFTVLLVTVIAVIVLWVNVNTPHSKTSKQFHPMVLSQKIPAQTFCLPCKSLQLTTPEENGVLQVLDRRPSPSGDTCCAKNSSHIVLMVQMILQRQLRYERKQGNLCPFKSKGGSASSACSTSSRDVVAAHITHKGTRYSKPDANRRAPYSLTQWNTSPPNAFLRGIQYRGSGQIAVPVDGLYHIYSQVYFTKDGSDTMAENPTGSLSHYIYRHSSSLPNGGEEILLRNGQSKCWAKKNCLEFTSHVSGVYFLHAEDRISVKVSHLHLVHHSTKYTYLGIYKL